jgi:K+-transporting ATPase ATPase A chain
MVVVPMSAALQAGLVIVVLAAVHVPLGNYLARVFTDPHHSRLERFMYRLIGVDPDGDQRWRHYLGALLGFSAVGVLVLYALLRVQDQLPLALGHPAVPPGLAFNTAVSFTTNTSWQSYAGESTLGHVAQMAGLGTQAFLSAAVGLAAGIALIRGLARRETDQIGNFWVDLIRGTLRVLLPLSVLFAVLLCGLGVIQSLHGAQPVTTLGGGHQSLPGGPVASWEPIKLMGGDGGGFFNANSAHPFENPGPVSNVVEIILMLLIPSALPRTFGRMVGDHRQGWALAAVVTALLVGGIALATAAQAAHHDPAPLAAGAAAEGTEVRFGPVGAATFGAAATGSADGAANASYDSFTSLGAGLLLVNIMLGEVSPGGVGSGLYGLIIAALVAVFLGGLMVGRTPEYLGKRIGPREIKLVSLYLLATPTAVLAATGLALALPAGLSAIANPGPHGLSEVLYAFTSAGNSNGSALAGLSANTSFYNPLLGLVMLLGRYLPMVFIIALAGSLARQRPTTITAGTLPTHRPLFVGLVLTVVLLITGLTYLPALALGPLAEGLH